VTETAKAQATFSIAPLRRRDLAACARLEDLLYAEDDPWSERIFASELAAGYRYFGAYDSDGTLIGYAGLGVFGRRHDHETSVHTIGVDPAWQRRGVGRTLLRELLAIADEIAAPVFLEVRTDNDVAIRMYEAHGFTRLGLRRRYYPASGADAYTMTRPAANEISTVEGAT
jgi:ribosomal-protein-alanine N-acetyltransferase